jgi:serine/threonine protein kinase
VKLLYDPRDYGLDGEIESLGNGGFGVVVKCTDKRNGKTCALKLSKEDDFDIQQQKYFLREVCAFAAINHPAAVKIVGYSLPYEGIGPAILLDLVPGGDLKEKMEAEENSWLDDTEKMILIAGITSIVAHFHSNGLIHRDIKPANILLDENLEPKLSDFGLARSFNEKSDIIGTEAGTNRYMAPEAFTGCVPSPALDIYSLGILMYEIIVGSHPYDMIEEKGNLMINLIRGSRPSIPSFVPAPLAEIITKAWSSNPEERLSAHEILQCLGNDECLLEGTDWNRYRDYYQKVYEATDPPMSQTARELYIKCETGDLIDWYTFAKQIITEDPKNPMVIKLATKFFEKAANENFYLACYELGKLYIKKPDPELKEKAVALFKVGVEHTHPESMYELGMCLKNGKGIKKNDKEAMLLFKKAGQLGLIDAYIEYARYTIIGGDGIVSNETKGKDILAALYKETNDPKIERMLLAFEED